MSYGQNPFKVGDTVVLKQDSILRLPASDKTSRLHKLLSPSVITSISPSNHYVRFWGMHDGWGWYHFEEAFYKPVNLDDYL